MAKDKGEGRKRARRSELPIVEEGERPQEEQQGEAEEPLVPPPNAYTFRLDLYTADCFVDSHVLIERGIILARGYFLDTRGVEVRVDIPTRRFFEFHSLDPNAPFLWESLCLQGYFALPLWGT